MSVEDRYPLLFVVQRPRPPRPDVVEAVRPFAGRVREDGEGGVHGRALVAVRVRVLVIVPIPIEKLVYPAENVVAEIVLGAHEIVVSGNQSPLRRASAQAARRQRVVPGKHDDLPTVPRLGRTERLDQSLELSCVSEVQIGGGAVVILMLKPDCRPDCRPDRRADGPAHVPPLLLALVHGLELKIIVGPRHHHGVDDACNIEVAEVAAAL